MISLVFYAITFLALGFIGGTFRSYRSRAKPVVRDQEVVRFLAA